MSARWKARGLFVVVAAVLVLFLGVLSAHAEVIINVLAVNGKDQPMTKDIEFSLPGELKPEDVLDAAGLILEYNVNDAGYYLHGEVLLQPKETKTFRVRVRDSWRVSPEEVSRIRADIEAGFKEMGSERSAENGQALREKLLSQLDYILRAQDEALGNIDQRMDAYRNHVQTLSDISTKATFIDYWRSDATDDEVRKPINYVIEVENPSDKPKKVKQQHYLPAEVKPEYVLDRQGYEIRFDDKKGKPFLFKEEDFNPKEKKNIRIGINDVWFVHQKDMIFLRERAAGVYDTLSSSKFGKTAKTLLDDITNNLDLIDMLQASQQENIQQHIGAHRINLKRFEKAKEDLDALEKLLARHRADLEKTRITNVMQKIRAMKSLARVSEAIFDKKPTINAAWKIIGSVMVFLGFFTVIHFVTWLIRSGRQKKQQEIKVEGQAKEEGKA